MQPDEPHPDPPYAEYTHTGLRLVVIECLIVAFALSAFWFARAQALEAFWLGAVTCALFACGAVYVGVEVLITRVAIRGEEFIICTPFQRTKVGKASDFMGCCADFRQRRWVLVRRQDLTTIEVHWFSIMGLQGVDVPIREWLRTYFAFADMTYVKLVALGEALPRATALHRLSTLSLKGGVDGAPAPDLDLQLAQAAHAVAVHGYAGARADLLRLARDLPGVSIARQFVVEALYSGRDPESLPGLIAIVKESRDEDLQDRIAHIICLLAGPAHITALAPFRSYRSPYVRRAAKIALARIKAAAQT